MSEQQDTGVAGQPRFVMAVGRGRTGKSTLLRYAIQRSLEAGKDVVVADGDRTNCSLVSFFGELAEQPSSPAPGDMLDWINGLVDRQAEDHRTVYLDLGGGDQMLATWAQEMDPVSFLTEQGITPVVLYCLGADLDDLSHVLELERVVQVPLAALVLNEGAVTSGAAPFAAFASTRKGLTHPSFRDIKARAKIVNFPRLRVMSKVERKEALTPTLAFMVRRWEREVAAEMAPIMDWLV